MPRKPTCRRLSIAVNGAADLARSALTAAALDGDARVRLEVPETLTLRVDARRLRQILVAHGGRVWAESGADEVTFHVGLPVST